MQKIKGCVRSNVLSISGDVKSSIQNISGTTTTSPSQYYYTKPEIDAFRAEDREYVNEQVLLLQADIDASGHKIQSILEDGYLVTSLLDINDNVISITSVELENKYISRGVYDSNIESIVLYYNDGDSISISLTGLINSLPTKQDVQDVQDNLDSEVTRAQTAEGALSDRVTTIENDYLTSTDKSQLQNEISNETTARQNADSALSNRITAIEDGFITQDINTSSIAIQYTKSTSKISLVSSHVWNTYECITNKSLLSCAYGNGYFIAVGQDGAVIYSQNAQNWNIFEQPFSATTLDKIVYGNGYFLALSFESKTIYKCYNPNVWTIYTTLDSSHTYTNLLYVNNRFVLTGEHGYLAFSTDGKNYKQIGVPSIQTINSVAFGNEFYVAVGDGGTLLNSKDGEEWINWSNNQFTEDYENICYYNGLFIANSYNSLLYSTNYYSFISANIPDLTVGSYSIQDITAGESNYYAIITNNITSKILNSTNGKNFVLEDEKNSATYDICYGMENFIIVGNLNKIYNLNLDVDWSYEKPTLNANEYLWCRNVNSLNNGDILYSAPYFMGYVDKDTNLLVNYYDIPTTDNLLDTKQDDMDYISNQDINNLFN